MKSLVSILIPAHNAGEWLAETLRSALAQTWERKEIILIDDGSTDQTLAVAREFEAQGVKVFTQANQGASATRNRAFSLSQGDYIQWLDADDLLSPDKIELQMREAERVNDRKVIFSSEWAQFLFRSSRARFVPTAVWCDLSPAEFLIRKMSLNIYMQTASWLVSREVVEAAGPWDPRLLGDDEGEYLCRVLAQSKAIRFVPGAKVYYRLSGTSSLSYIGASAAKVEAQWQSMKVHMRTLRSLEESARVHAACVKYMQDWLIHFYPEHPELLREMQAAAEEMGIPLALPRLSWKYAWIAQLFGWSAAKRAQRTLPALRWSALRAVDRLFHSISPAAAGQP